MKNYLFSTTRQWNPGDEFILHGILRVLRSIDPKFNPIIFNRNPEIKHREGSEVNFQLDLLKLRGKRLKPGFYDNSFKRGLLSRDFIDLVVFSGTPEWASGRMRVLYDYIERYSIPTIYLGIGVGSEDFDLEIINKKYKSIIRNALLVTVRDRILEKVLCDLNVVCLPCPALLSAPPIFEKKVKKIEKVGLIYMSNTGVRSNQLNDAAHCFLIDFYKTILSVYKDRFCFEFVCHYIDELAVFCQDFPDHSCHYSYDSGEYARIYNQFDLVVSPRVHGIGIAASMGIPGISIQHDARGEMCLEFMADVVKSSASIDDAIRVFGSKVEQFLAQGGSDQLLLKKQAVFDQYVELLRPVLNKI